MAAAEKTRLDAPDLTPAARKSITRVAKEADRVQAAEAVVTATPAPAADAALLVSVTGIGRLTATTVLAELPPVRDIRSAESAAAYCRLAPAEFQSGKSVGACMRKLVMICYGVLKNRTPFDPQWASRNAC